MKEQFGSIEKTCKHISYELLRKSLEKPLRDYLQQDAIVQYQIEKTGETYTELKTKITTRLEAIADKNGKLDAEIEKLRTEENAKREAR